MWLVGLHGGMNLEWSCVALRVKKYGTAGLPFFTGRETEMETVTMNYRTDWSLPPKRQNRRIGGINRRNVYPLVEGPGTFDEQEFFEAYTRLQVYSPAYQYHSNLAYHNRNLLDLRSNTCECVQVCLLVRVERYHFLITSCYYVDYEVGSRPHLIWITPFLEHKQKWINNRSHTFVHIQLRGPVWWESP